MAQLLQYHILLSLLALMSLIINWIIKLIWVDVSLSALILWYYYQLRLQIKKKIITYKIYLLLILYCCAKEQRRMCTFNVYWGVPKIMNCDKSLVSPSKRFPLGKLWSPAKFLVNLSWFRGGPWAPKLTKLVAKHREKWKNAMFQMLYLVHWLSCRIVNVNFWPNSL